MRMAGEGEASRSNEQPIDSGIAIVIGIVVVGIVPLIVTGLGVRWGRLRRRLRLSGRWLHRNDGRPTRRRGTRRDVDCGCALVFLARGQVLKCVGEEIRSIGLRTPPDFSVSEGWTEQPREKTQEDGGLEAVHTGPLFKLYPFPAPVNQSRFLVAGSVTVLLPCKTVTEPILRRKAEIAP